MNLFRLALLLLLPLFLMPVGTTWGGEETAFLLDSDLPYRARKRNPVTYGVDFRVIVTAPYGTKLLRVWLPVPPSDEAQEVRESRFNTFPRATTPSIAKEPLHGNTFAYFELENPQGAQIIQHRFTIRVWELDWGVEPDKVARVRDWPASFDRYRRSESQSVVVDERIRSLARDIVPTSRGEAFDVANVLGWVTGNLKYDHANASLAASSMHAIEQREGHCSDYHGLCASLGRALGYPARVTYGIHLFPKSSPSHCKLEVFLPPYGWVSFDASETQRMIAGIRSDAALSPERQTALIQAANARLFRGFRDNTWFLQTRGTDYDLAPKASRRVPVVRTIHAEADGVPLKDPDPASPTQSAYSWMTAHEYTPDRTVTYPFKDVTTLSAVDDGATPNRSGNPKE